MAALCLALFEPGSRATAQPLDAGGQTVAAPDAFAGLSLRLDRVESGLTRDGLTDDELIDFRNEVEEVRKAGLAESTRLQPRLGDIDARLAQLGPAPADGDAPEASEVAAQRSTLNQAKGTVEGAVRRANLLIVRASQIDQTITARQRDRFTERIATRSHSFLSPGLWAGFLASLPRIVSSLGLLTVDTLANIKAQFTLAKAGILLLSVLFAFLVWRVLWHALDRFAGRDAPGAATPENRIPAAIVRFLRSGVLPALAIFVPYLTYRVVELAPGRAGAVTDSIFSAFVTVSLFWGLVNAYLAPTKPEWRLIPFTTPVVVTLVGLVIAIASVSAGDRVLASIAEVSSAPVEFEAAISGLAAVLIAGLSLALLRRIKTARDAAGISGPDSGFLRWPLLRVLIWVSSLSILVSALSGYLAFASFVALQTVSAILIVGVFRLMISFAGLAIAGTTAPGGGLNAFSVREFGLPESTIHQFGTLLSGLSKVLLVALAAVLLMLPWGFNVERWFFWLERAFFGFDIGGVYISPASIIAGIVIFLIVLVFARAFRRWLEETYLPTTRLDVGLRNSIATGTYYVGAAIAIGVAITYAGIDLSNFALIAGALSVGIGFGLQSIVSNFVSGLILLAERPIKAGDWIVVGNEQGTVRKISVRATEIETFDRASVIIPNSDLISGTVMNWTHSDSLGRFVILVGVSYDSDPEQVRDLLLEIVNDHPDVLSFPEPMVFFLDFGASSLDFRIHGFLRDINQTLAVRSDLRFTIIKRFREAGIEIPFPQSDLHVRSVTPEAAAALAGRSTPEAKT